MFDGIIYNMITDMVRNGMIAAAAYLGLTGNTQTQFVAGGLAIAAGLWQWYENGGHQKIVNALKLSNGAGAVSAAKDVPLSISNAAISRAAKILPFLIIAGALSIGDAKAQMVTKTPPAVASVGSLPCTPALCSGMYVGGTIGVGIVAADFGAQYYNGAAFLGAEAGIGAQVYTDPALTNNENGLLAWQIGKVGGTLSGLLGATATPTGLPTGIAAQVIAPYALAGAVEHQIGGIVQTGWTTGGGVEYDVSSRLFIDVKYMLAEYGTSSKVQSESIVLASANYKF